MSLLSNPLSAASSVGRVSLRVWWCMLMLALPNVSHAADEASGRVGYQFHVENDVFARERTDRWFTNGLRFSSTIAQPSREHDRLTRWLLDRTEALALGEGVRADTATRQVTYTLGQNMYTPRRIGVAEPQRQDRPWAGWLYAGITVQGYSERGGLADAGEFQQTDLKMGVTGRASGAARAQRWFHKVIDSEYPAGWEQQLKQQFGIQLSHLRIYRFGDTDTSRSADWFGFHAGGGVTVGNLRSYGTVVAGLVAGPLRGRNPVFVPANEGDFVIQDFGKGPAYDRWLGFINVSLTGVAANRFITGPTPYGRSDIRLRRSVAAWQWGLAFPMPFTEGWRVVYTQTARGSEFDSPSVGAREGLQRWGAVTLTRALQ